jgi:hypothetical protein
VIYLHLLSQINVFNNVTSNEILSKAKKSLKDAAAVNATRNKIFFSLRELGLPVESSTGGRTKYNRSRFHIPKSHALDAACVGKVDSVQDWNKQVLCIKAQGRGSYQRTRVDQYGFARGYLTRQKRVHGFQTGDLVKAIVLKGKKQGTYVGRVAVRARGYFNIKVGKQTITDIHYRYCQLLQRVDGYSYA